MYEAEIGDALDRGDMSILWIYMLKRTAWLQHARLTHEQVCASIVATEDIIRRVQSEQLPEIEAALGAARRQRKLTQAYEGGRQQ